MARVLLADDDATALQFAERALTADGHVVVTASDGQDALGRIQNDKAIDLLVTDLDMPVLDGLALYARVAPLRPRLRVLMISGHADELRRAGAGLPAERVATLLKPFTLQQIRAAVKALLER